LKGEERKKDIGRDEDRNIFIDDDKMKMLKWKDRKTERKLERREMRE
jgi:hypothetical protein